MSEEKNSITIQDPIRVLEAYQRIESFILKTPIFVSEDINNEFGHDFFFKIDALQHSKAFKIRGILNHILELNEKSISLDKIVAYSTGNHGIGLSLVASWFGIKARVYMPEHTSKEKQELILSNGAELILTKTRQEAEDKTKIDSIDNGFYYLHPSDSDTTIAGVGTLCYEALAQMKNYPDAIFAACGGGGLLSGTYLAKELASPKSLVFGSEPELANDAYISKKQGSIFRFKDSPHTIADGLKALSLSARTFEYIKKIDDIFVVSDENIGFWTQKLTNIIKVNIEPSAAINMHAAVEWIKTRKIRQKILIIISGGNVAI